MTPDELLPVPPPVAVPAMVMVPVPFVAGRVAVEMMPELPLAPAAALPWPLSEIAPLPAVIAALLERPLSKEPVPPPVPLSVMVPVPVLVMAPLWLIPKLLAPLELPPVPVIEIAVPEPASNAPAFTP